MNFNYDKTKKYKLTNDITDVENWVGCRIPMLLKLPFPQELFANLTEDEVIKRISSFLFVSATFTSVWKKLGADDVRTLPTGDGTMVMTALKSGKVLKQTTFVM